MAVYFHGNFGLNRPRMAGVLKLGLENPQLKDAELAKPFDYGAPFAAKYRSWLHKTGIIELNFPMRLTPMGEVVWEKDSKLETLTTQWFMHWELTQDPTRAEAWHYFANEFLPQHETFAREDLLEGITMKLRVHSEKHFGPRSKLNPVIVRKLIECYTQSFGLSDLALIRISNHQFLRNDISRRQGPWNEKSELQLAYNDAT